LLGRQVWLLEDSSKWEVVRSMVRRKREQGCTKTVSVSDLRPGDLVPLAVGPAANVLDGVDPVPGETYALKVYPTTLEPRVREDVTVELDRLARARAMAPVLVADRVVQHEGRAALRIDRKSTRLNSSHV